MNEKSAKLEYKPPSKACEIQHPAAPRILRHISSGGFRGVGGGHGGIVSVQYLKRGRQRRRGVFAAWSKKNLGRGEWKTTFATAQQYISELEISVWLADLLTAVGAVLAVSDAHLLHLTRGPTYCFSFPYQLLV